MAVQTCDCGFVEYDAEQKIWVLSKEWGVHGDSPLDVGEAVWWRYCPECGISLPGPRNADKLVAPQLRHLPKRGEKVACNG